MSQSNETTVVKAPQTSAPTSPTTKSAPASIKDTGRVHIGGGLMRF